MANLNFKQFDDSDSSVTEIEAKANETLEKIKFQEQKIKFDAKIDELARQAADFCTRYGEEDWRTSLLVNFLDLSLQMKDIIELVTAFNVANEIIFHAMNLMNTSLNMSNGMMMQFSAESISPWRQRMITRRAIRNNRNTVKNMLYQMESSIRMASLTAGMYEDMSSSISKIMNKMNMKREKAKKKKDGQPAMTSSDGRGMDMVRSLMANNGTAAPAPKPASAKAPDAPKPSTPPGTDTGLDGII